MKKKIHHRIINVFLLALFLCYFGSITLFYHCHTVDGVTIVHSHFYNNSGDTDSNADNNHTHSDSEINLISNLSLFISLIAFTTFIFKCFFSKTFKVYINRCSYHLYRTIILNLSLRAPPCTII